ncbi:MAG: hypothetical protein JSW52_03710 [Candidatus Coatesbacteria bacterium]|nr:MAG: hypothetical protein JSW52_03710 [Candidatus Coatesbacteria bacterium]
MFSKTIVITLLLVTAAGAASTLDIQLGLTQFHTEKRFQSQWGGYYYYSFYNNRGYVSNVNYELAFSNWAVALDMRALIFPGSSNSVAIYADVNAPYYFSKAPVRIYASPGLGYNHTEKRIPILAAPPGQTKRDYFRFPVAFGVKAVSGTKYLDIRYRIAAEFPVSENNARDFYLEQTIEGEFGWAFAKHFGMTAKAGAVRGNYAITINTGDYAPPYVAYAQVAPSIYF